MIRSKTLEMGGIYREDFIEYFLKIGKTDDEETFIGPYWEVFVGPQTWSNLGALRIQHVLITFNIEEDMFDEFIAEFRLNFLRCGG